MVTFGEHRAQPNPDPTCTTLGSSSSCGNQSAKRFGELVCFFKKRLFGYEILAPTPSAALLSWTFILFHFAGSDLPTTMRPFPNNEVGLKWT